MWPLADIADEIEATLRREAERCDREQAVRGLDTLDEIDLHPILADGLRHAGYGVAREQRYPSDWKRRRETEGERCDLVLTNDGRPLRVPDRRATLFDDPDAVDLDEALWLEVKVVLQHTEEGPNARYASSLLSTVRQDVAKLSKDDGILHAALLIVLFVADAMVAEHDLGIWQNKCLDRGLPIGAPYRRTREITDRLGNRACVIALYPVGRA
ncbi:MAG: hypothetical protein HKO59_13770 [Phycisphaerales bacterium]|nr:hypothetical protein [Phycisphaerae bacterium]NNF45115.1 hypothetical protein [Phycisphaerales bacterium]NNM27029.1 hypothetical protein [Phycisphaerales bacterium]